MKATAELPSRAEKAYPDIVFSCICSKILISFNLILQVSPVITRWSGCTNPDRDIGEARSKFGAD